MCRRAHVIGACRPLVPKMVSSPWSYLRGYETGTLATPAGPLPDPRNDDAPENKVVGGVVVGIGPSRISLILHLVESPYNCLCRCLVASLEDAAAPAAAHAAAEAAAVAAAAAVVAAAGCC
jgi:hypothetical protein